MKKGLLAVLFSILCCGNVLAQFEGIVESKNITVDETGTKVEYTMTLWVKPDMVKIMMKSKGESMGNTMIYRNDLARIWMINESDKSYFEINQKDQPVEQQAFGDDEKYELKRTGKKKIILNFPCEEIVLTRGEERTEIWATPKLKSLEETLVKAFGVESTQGVKGWDGELASLGLYPLSAKITSGGVLMELQEVKSVVQKKVAPTEFDIPTGYKKQNMQDMLEDAEKSGGGE